MRLLARLFVGIIGLTAAPARAQFTISNHSADGGGSAQLFDGGPPVADSDSAAARRSRSLAAARRSPTSATS